MYDPMTGISYPDQPDPMKLPEDPSLYGPPDDYWAEDEDDWEDEEEDGEEEPK